MASHADDMPVKPKGKEEVLTYLRDCFNSEQDPLKSLSERFSSAQTKLTPTVVDEEE